MVRLVLVALALIGCAVAQDPNHWIQICDLKQLNQAQAALNSELGFNSTDGVLNPRGLRHDLEALLGEQSAFGLAQICSAMKAFKTSFNSPQDYDKCLFNPHGLVLNDNQTLTGISKEDAIYYTRIFAQFDFACGAGFSQFANNNEGQGNSCAGDVFRNSAAGLEQCYHSMWDKIRNDSANTCSYASVAAYCVSTYFRQCGIPAMWFGCEYERIGTQVIFPECLQNFCTFNPTA